MTRHLQHRRYGIRRRKPLRRKTPLKGKSEKGELEGAIFDLIREVLKIERGNKCEISGRLPYKLGLFHIMDKSLHPRLKFHRRNLLLVNWMPYHYYWHKHRTDHPIGKYVQRRIEEIKGKNYKQEFLITEAMQPKLTMSYLTILYKAWKQEFDQIHK